MSRRILTCRVKIAHATQEPMHMSASPWSIVRKGKNAVRVSYPAHTESLNNAQDMRGRGCSSSDDPHSWSSGLGRGEYLVEKQTNKQTNFVILIIACRAGVSKDRTSEETRQPLPFGISFWLAPSMSVYVSTSMMATFALAFALAFALQNTPALHASYTHRCMAPLT